MDLIICSSHYWSIIGPVKPKWSCSYFATYILDQMIFIPCRMKIPTWSQIALHSTMFPHILCQNSMKSPAYSSRPHQKLAKNGLKCPQIKKWYKTDPNWNLISIVWAIFWQFIMFTNSEIVRSSIFGREE